MNWHTRYAQQANWTRDLRHYIFEKVNLRHSSHVLEVGCGTGAVLSELSEKTKAYGLDINRDSLIECLAHATNAFLTQGNAIDLPFAASSFTITYSHFLLLWVDDPLRALLEMKRVTQKYGYVIAFAEPNYLHRVDQPEGLIPLGKWQTEALIRHGADPGLGGRLAELFFEAGIHIIETGVIQSQGNEFSSEEWKLEWDVLESDLKGWVPDQDIQEMKRVDQQARRQKTRLLHVPTHFAWGRV